MGYHTADEIPIYWKYAKTFTLNDRMFAPTDSWTLPAHLFLISAWSANCTDLERPDELQRRTRSSPAGQYADKRRRSGRRRWGRRDPTCGRRSRGSSTTHGVSWRYYVGEGTCVAPPCEKLDGIDTAPVQNPLPGFTAIDATGQLDNIRSERRSSWRDAKAAICRRSRG